MRAWTAAAALLCAAALVAYPLTLFPGEAWARWLAALVLGLSVGAIASRSNLLVAAAGATSVSFFVFSLAGSARPEPPAAAAGGGILVLLELLELAVSPPGPVDRSLLRRRMLWIAGVSLAGGAVALVAQALGELLEAPHPLLFVVAAGCAAVALALIASLGWRAVSDDRS